MNSLGLLDHPFRDSYASRLGALPGAAHPWLDGLRQGALSALGGGLPGHKEEAWRFTPLRSLVKVPFIPAAAADDVDVAEVPRAVPSIAGAARVVLVNGVFRQDMSDADFGSGVSVRDMHSVLAAPDVEVRQVLGSLASLKSSPLVALNTAYMAGGVAIHAGDRVKTGKIIHIVSIGAAGAEPMAFHPRVSVVAGEEVSLTIVESHVGLPGQPYFSNPVTEISVGEKSEVRRYVNVAEDDDAFHLATTAVNISEAGTFEAFHLGLGGRLVRQDIAVAFAGERARARVNGAYALARNSHHDFTTFMDHSTPSCTSDQIFKGVVDGKSRAVYQGRILVERDAQKTDARQLHKALFLSRGPQIDCKPELEIYADDVQCAHGAATGEIDSDQLFYLTSRGIDPDTARGLLVEGFLADAVAQIQDGEIRDLFTADIGAWLKRREIRSGSR
jgi:Fe-S cluster assembly protein SufD